MSGELLQKVKELQKLIIEKSNKEFTKNAVEQINPEAVDEDILPCVEEPCEVKTEDSCETAENIEEHPCEDAWELERLCIEEALRKSISEEEEAVSKYVARARDAMVSNQPMLEALYRELATDEIVHAASLREALKAFCCFDRYAELKGKLEFADITGYPVAVQEASMEEEAAALQAQADKEKKDFDFVQEYVKNKAEYNKEKVVNALNDLITGKSDLSSTVDLIIKDGKKVVDKEEKEPKKVKKSSKKNDKKDEK